MQYLRSQKSIGLNLDSQDEDDYDDFNLIEYTTTNHLGEVKTKKLRMKSDLAEKIE